MLKKLYFAAIMCVLCLSAGVTAFANSEENAILRFEMGSTTFTRDGMPRQMDVAPFIDTVHNRAMLPLRVIAEELGMTVDWIDTTRTVNLERGGFSVSLNIDTPLPDGMGMPVIVNDRAMVPVRYIAETLNVPVDWDQETSTSIIAVTPMTPTPTPPVTIVTPTPAPPVTLVTPTPIPQTPQ